jgi:3'-phosphoadenosine 5'-phosphosulfate sulfotransferase (PAPS reductase)/FAD synthetase
MNILDKSTFDPEKGRVISWFSCGAASAVASKLAIQEHSQVEIIYQETNSEHPDNQRFLEDCQSWFGQEIIKISSDKFHDIWEVFEKRRYIGGVYGAPCTSELKRIPAEKYINHGYDLEVFGFTVEEFKRAEDYRKNNFERRVQAILIERGLTKDDCLGMIYKVGIEIPAMYKLGYRNNNCVGCVKGQMGYWGKIREDFPEVFERMAKLERKFNAAICKSYAGDKKRKRVFLDELPINAGNFPPEKPISCGILCEIEHDRLSDD